MNLPIRKKISILLLSLLILWACPSPADKTELTPIISDTGICLLDVSVSPEGAGTLQCDPLQESYKDGDRVNISITAKDGWTFTGWSGASESTETTLDLTLTEDTELTALFVPIKLSLATAVSGSGSISVSPEGDSFQKGTPLSLTAVPETGWAFVNWTKTDTEAVSALDDMDETVTKGAVLEMVLQNNENLTAVFSQTPFVLSTETEGSGSVTLTKQDDGTYLLTAVPETGWSFTRWEEGITGNDNPCTHSLTADITAKAVFTLNRYTPTVTLDGTGSVTITPSSEDGKYDHGTVITLTPSPTNTTITSFSGWSGDITGSENPASVTLTKDISVTAEFIDRSWNLNPTITGEGSVNVTSGGNSFVAGQEITLQAVPAAGWSFYRWDDGSTLANRTKKVSESDIDANGISVSAEFVKNKWTILSYMNGDNNMETALLNDLNEMEAGLSEGKGVNFIVLADRSPDYDTGDGNWSDTRLFRMKHDSAGANMTLISEELSSSVLSLTTENSEELNLGNRQILESFLKYGQADWQAEHYALIIWGHGSGWRSTGTDSRAYVFDDTSGGDPLYNQELRLALEGAGFNSSQKLDVLAFDTCFAAMLETAYEIKDSANYMIASEEVEPTDGWNYSDFISRFLSSGLTASDFTSSALESFENHYGTSSAVTLSSLDLSKANSVNTALNELCVSLQADGTAAADSTSFYQSLKQKIGDSSLVEDFYQTPGDLNIDVKGLADYLSTCTLTGVSETSKSKASALSSAVSSCLTGKIAGGENSGASGLAIHFVPLNSSGSYTSHNSAYFKGSSAGYPLKFTADSSWVPDAGNSSGLIYKMFY